MFAGIVRHVSFRLRGGGLALVVRSVANHPAVWGVCHVGGIVSDLGHRACEQGADRQLPHAGCCPSLRFARAILLPGLAPSPLALCPGGSYGVHPCILLSTRFDLGARARA